MRARVVRGSPAERFWPKAKTGRFSDCWPWTAATDPDGYAMFWLGPRAMRRGHAVAYELEIGPVPTGMVLDHVCHDATACPGGRACQHRRCVNPWHVVPVLRPDNTVRGRRVHRSQHGVAA